MQQSEPIRVLVIDDHDMVRRGLAAFLMVAPDLQMVGEGRNGQEAIAMCETMHPDVVLMDLMMPVMDGAAATRDSQPLACHSGSRADQLRGEDPCAGGAGGRRDQLSA